MLLFYASANAFGKLNSPNLYETGREPLRSQSDLRAWDLYVRKVMSTYSLRNKLTKRRVEHDFKEYTNKT